MALQTPGILPGSMPVDLSRGHPLLFYFLTAIWLKIFGNSVFSSHVFTLITSISLIVTIFVFCRKFFSPRLALVASAAVLFQGIFISQSCQVIPEMMMALWIMLSFLTWFAEKNLWFMLIASCMMLTKETGVVCIASIGAYQLISDLLNQGYRGVITNYRRYLVLGFPVLIAVIYFVIQRVQNGWFFFPLHIRYISFSWNDILHKFKAYFAYTFIYYGRNVLLFGGLISAIIIGVRFRRQSEQQKQLPHPGIIGALSLYLLFLLLFNSINFYSDRYMLIGIGPFIIVSCYFIDQAIKPMILKWVAIAAIVVAALYYDATNISKSSSDLGYVHGIYLYQDCVNYCISHKWQNQKINAGFQMQIALTDTLSGYVGSNDLFNYVSSDYLNKADIVILEPDAYSDSVKTLVPMHILQRFVRSGQWIGIYAVDKNSGSSIR